MQTRPFDGSGIYRYHCPQHKKDYVGETKRSFRKHNKEYHKAAEQNRWTHSGLTEHMEHCSAENEGPKILFNAKRKNKNPKFDLRVSEALCIRQLNCGPGKGLKKDFGSYLTTTQWEPVFNKMRQSGGPGSSLPL